jgi:two-component system cell cycle sensor histidine kinase/response regulator CckA
MRSSINRTKEELEGELIELRQRAAELEVERKQVVEILRESEEKYRRVAENCTVGTAMTHGDRIIYMNEAGCRILGWEEESLIGRSILDLVAPEDRPFLRERVERKLRGDKVSTHYTIRGMRKDNTELLIEVSSSDPFTYKGKAAILAVFRDVTERQKRERDLLKTQKLESIGTLAGGIAHDFNNILTAILGNISLAKMYTDLNSIFGKLADAEKACLQAQDLTKQLLTFAKGGVPIKKATSIVELLKDSVAFALRGSNVRREFSITDDLWMAEIDIEQIEQVINNLIVNARQAMPEGGTVEIRAENMTVGIKDTLPLKDGEYVKISIQDQGIGIPEGHLQRIFDPYFSTKQQGSGLGLSTSYSIIKNHEGYIDVESQMGLGTTFHIYIPACPDGVLIKEESAKEEFW